MAQVDRFAERGERFWFHVDGDGDGVRGIVMDSPSVDVLPGPARAAGADAARRPRAPATP